MAMAEEKQSPSSGEFEIENQLVDPYILASPSPLEYGTEQIKLLEGYVKEHSNLLLFSGNSGVEHEDICKFGRSTHAKEVTKIRNLSTGEIHVKKVIPVRYFNAYEVMCQNEIQETGHSPKLKWADINHQNVELYMDFIEGEEVDTVLKSPDIDQDTLKLLDWHILDCGIEALLSFAEKGWNHGDLFERNLIMENVSSTSCPKVSIKVIDFGYAKPFQEPALIKDFHDLLMVVRLLMVKLNDEGKKDMDYFLNEQTISRVTSREGLNEYHLEVKKKKAEVYTDHCLMKINEQLFHPEIAQKTLHSHLRHYSSSSSELSSVDELQNLEGLQEFIRVPSPKFFSEQPDLFQSFKDLRIKEEVDVSKMFVGKQFCIINGPASRNKQELEKNVVEYGGTIVQNPGVETYCVVVDKKVFQVHNLIKSNNYDIVKAEWLIRCLDTQMFIPWSPGDMINATPATQKLFQPDFDPFGDSCAEDVTSERLKDGFEKIEYEKVHSFSHMEIAELENKYFPDDSPYGLFRTCNTPAPVAEGDGVGNPVGELQELTQKKLMKPPIYEFTSEQGPPHAREFVCIVKLGKIQEKGSARSKKTAKRIAAQNMLNYIKGLVEEGGNAVIEEDEDEEIPLSIEPLKASYTALKDGKVKVPVLSPKQNKEIQKLYQTVMKKSSKQLKSLQGKPLNAPATNYCQMLQEIAEAQRFEVLYTDIPELSAFGMHQCLVQLSTMPVAVCHGTGPTVDDAHANAAHNSLQYLKLMTKS